MDSKSSTTTRTDHDSSTDPMVLDMTEWNELGRRMAIAGARKFTEILQAVRKIVEAQETIATFDWQLLFGRRPSKRYKA